MTTPDSTPATVEGVMSIAFELARIREQHGAQSGMYLSEVRALRAEAERLAAQSAPTGLTDMGWVIDAATKGELAAYDQGIAESIQAVTKILDGKDAGAGIADRPWEPLRRRLLALVAQSAPLAQQARECPPLPARAFSIDAGSGGSVPGYSADQMRAYVDADRAAAQVDQPAGRVIAEDSAYLQSTQGQDAAPAEQPCHCPACLRWEDAPHEYHLEQRPKGKK